MRSKARLPPVTARRSPLSGLTLASTGFTSPPPIAADPACNLTPVLCHGAWLSGFTASAASPPPVWFQAAFADHHPGELVEGIRPGPADRGTSLDLEAAEPVRVDSRPGLGEHHRLTLPQQPPVAGPDHLPGHQQDQPAGQLIAMVAPRRYASAQRQIGPAGTGGIRAASQPPLLPGPAGLAIQPVQQPGQPAVPTCSAAAPSLRARHP